MAAAKATIANLTPEQVNAINRYEENFTKEYGTDIVLVAMKK